MTEDLLQKTNVILWKKRMEWDSSTVFLKWAYRIAYFQVKAHFRDQQRERQRLVFDDDVLDLLAEGGVQFEAMDTLQEALARCLRRMDQKKRRWLLERYQSETAVEDLAVKYNYLPNAFSQMLRRLRVKLSKCIQDELDSGTLTLERS